MKYLAFTICFCALCAIPITCITEAAKQELQGRVVTLNKDTLVGTMRITLKRDTVLPTCGVK